MDPRCGSDLAVPVRLVGWSEPGNQARVVTLVSGRKTHRPGEIAILPGSAFGKGHSCTCWPKPDDSSPCTPQTCDWRCRACRIYGRPFYSRDDLQYLEHGTGSLAGELARLWRAKGAMKGRPAQEGVGDEVDGWRALPRGAAGLAARRRSARAVTKLYYLGLQDRPPGRDEPNNGRGP